MTPQPAVLQYELAAGTSRFTARGYAAGLLSGMGHNPIVAIREFSGEARGDPSDPSQASVRVTVKAASLTVENDMSDKDRREMTRAMQEDVLEISRYPEISYESVGVTATGPGRVQIDGNLTLHGVTRPHRILAQVSRTGTMLRAFGDFTLRQSDYRIKPVSVAGGVLKLKDELKITFDIVAHARTA